MALFTFGNSLEERFSAQGARVMLRPARLSDHAEWAQLRESSRAFLVPWEPTWKPDDLTRSSFRERIKRNLREIESDSAYSMLVFRRSDGVMLGSITIGLVRRGVAQAATFGYWIGAAHARQGYMSDALRTAITFCFGTLGLMRLEAACLPRNMASIALLERAGFEREGLARSYLKINGIREDHILFALLSAERVTPSMDR
jgi:[ribosomal protein S5]-alanine N-acetyltransferase